MTDEEDLDPLVMLTENDDGSADATVEWADEDHRFSVATEGSHAIVSYEETLSWRGEIRNKEPPQEVFRELMVNDKMTEFLNENDLDGIRREKVPQ